MIDFTISNDPSLSRDKSMVSTKKCKRYSYNFDSLLITCDSYIPESDFFAENEYFKILVAGTLFESINSNNAFSKINAVKLLKTIGKIIAHPNELRGIFALILLDKKKKELIIINDIFGFSPIYYGKKSKKIYITNNLLNISSKFKVNEYVLLEKVIFEHSISDDTILNDIKRLDNASILKYSSGEIIIESYFDWLDFFLNPGNRTFAKNEFLELFNEIIKKRSSIDNKCNLITLTGGHDGRAVISGFIKNKISFETFSFGRPGSENTYIPEQISKSLGFKHTSIYLMEDFENEYFLNSLKTIVISDGELPFEQQSTLYASQLLENKSDYVYTGLLAGEILGPMRNIRNYLNYNLFKSVFLNDNCSVKKYLRKNGIDVLINSNYDNNLQHSIEEKINRQRSFLSIFDKHNLSHLKIMYHLVTYGFKYFYGSQIHLRRYSLMDIPVFYDFDLFTTLLTTDFHYRYINNFKALLKRSNAREIQIYIINKNSKALSRIPVDLGFPPYFYDSFFLKPLIPIFYLKRKYRLKKQSIPKDFISNVWSKNIYNRSYFNQMNEDDLFSNKKILEYLDFINNDSYYYNYEKNRVISLYIYNNLLNNHTEVLSKLLNKK